MRVITGTARGHKLKTPEGKMTRPTTDKIKESLFNILSAELDDCVFLDLFSGSGAIGIEALSRGAREAYFADISGECCRMIQENLIFTKLAEKAKVFKQDAVGLIHTLGKEEKRFDIIFMDPPYEAGLSEPALEAIVKAGILKPEGFIIVERDSSYPLKTVYGLKITREKEYKTTTMTFLTTEE